MSGHRCLIRSQRALPRVLPKGEAHHALRQLPLWSQPRTPSYANTACPSRIRPLSTAVTRWKKKDKDGEQEEEVDESEFIDRRWTTEATLEKTGRDRWPWDHEITDPKIMVYDQGSIEGPLETKFVLTKIATHESLRMVTPYEPPNRKTGKEEKFPLCKIVEKAAEYKKKKEEQAKKKEQKAEAPSGKTKSFEINWTSTDHDTANRVKRICEALVKGHMADVTLSAKRKSRKKDMSSIDFAHVLKHAKEGIEHGGGKERKKAQGELGGEIKLFYERDPKGPKSRPDTEGSKGGQPEAES